MHFLFLFCIWFFVCCFPFFLDCISFFSFLFNFLYQLYLFYGRFLARILSWTLILPIVNRPFHVYLDPFRGSHYDGLSPFLSELSHWQLHFYPSHDKRLFCVGTSVQSIHSFVFQDCYRLVKINKSFKE